MRWLWRSVLVIGSGLLAFALAFFLGWLKSLYYFDAFGVGLSGLDLTVRDYLLESWFVIQNLLFFGLMWWVILQSRLYWTAVFGALHALIPITAHYALAASGTTGAEWLIAYRHTLLKLLPFGLLAAIWFFAPERRRLLRSLRWSSGPAALALLGLVTLSWGVSLAKHSGSFDAHRIQRSPELYLSRIRLHPSSPAELLPTGSELYLLHAGRDRLVVWDGSDFRYGSSDELRVLVLPRRAVASIELTRVHQLQPGGQYF